MVQLAGECGSTMTKIKQCSNIINNYSQLPAFTLLHGEESVLKNSHLDATWCNIVWTAAIVDTLEVKGLTESCDFIALDGHMIGSLV